MTQLANFACRSGDLQPDALAGPTAREGMRAHQALQSKRKQSVDAATGLISEHKVLCEIEVEHWIIQLGGRIDLANPQAHVLSEIKSTYVPTEQIGDSQQALHWAQLYIYGYIYLKQLCESQLNEHSVSESDIDLPELTLELIYVNIRAQTEDSLKRVVTQSELSEFSINALQIYAQWLSRIDNRHAQMTKTANRLEFPFGTFRPGQRDMAASIYRASRDAAQVMCEAPTGIGKTLSSLFPAIKSMGEGAISQLVYLTAKVAGRHAAEQAIKQMTDVGLRITTLQIRAKVSTCFCTNGRCERDLSERCPMTLGFFDRLPAARDELLSIGVIDNATLDEVAWQHQLCPFELIQQLLPWVQLVVADYNYVYDPLVRLPHFSTPCKRTLVLVDEAHNLADRARAMYSARLDRIQVMNAASECRSSQRLLAPELDKLARRLRDVASQNASGYEIFRESPGTLSKAVAAVLSEMNSHSQSDSVVLFSDTLRELWLGLCRFAVISDLFSDNHRMIVESSKLGRRQQVVVSLYCVDASRWLSASYGMFRSTVLFSATLRPGEFYKDTLGLNSRAGYLQLSSPFDAGNCLRCVVDWIDTRYRQRQKSMAQLVELIHNCTSKKQGSYLVFFPSYAYLEQVHAAFVSAYPGVSTWVQSRQQTREEHQVLLDKLDVAGHKIGFAIQGGVFGEGIDYIGDRLIGALIIGTGLPAVDWQSELMSEHYREAGHNGYEFAYRFPGFTRVLQTAGRVIRRESDRGVIVLVDTRFSRREYKALFPDDWQLYYPRNGENLDILVQNFWERHAG